MWPMTYQDVKNKTFPFPLDTFPLLCSIDSYICDCEATNNISNQVSLTGSWSSPSSLATCYCFCVGLNMEFITARAEPPKNNWV